MQLARLCQLTDTAETADSIQHICVLQTQSFGKHAVDTVSNTVKISVRAVNSNAVFCQLQQKLLLPIGISHIAQLMKNCRMMRNQHISLFRQGLRHSFLRHIQRQKQPAYRLIAPAKHQTYVIPGLCQLRRCHFVQQVDDIIYCHYACHFAAPPVLPSTLRFPYTFRSRVRARCVPYSPTAVCR